MRAKKSVAIVLALLMFLLPLACEKKPTYRVIVENGMFVDLRERYAEGETVRLNVDCWCRMSYSWSESVRALPRSME